MIDVRDAIDAGIVEGPRIACGAYALITGVGGTAGRLINDDGVTGYYKAVHNGDEILKEVRRQIKGQLQTAERLSAINRVTSGVAHEVKNPLNAMLMHVELARIKLGKGDYDVSQQMEIISNEILRLDRVVKTFLDFTRPAEIKATEVAVDAFVSELVELARPQAQAVGVTVSADLGAAGATMVVDSDLLKQAALNIVVNGIEAMPQGGELRFESSLAGEEVEIRISDSGPGEGGRYVYGIVGTKEHVNFGKIGIGGAILSASQW